MNETTLFPIPPDTNVGGPTFATHEGDPQFNPADIANQARYLDDALEEANEALLTGAQPENKTIRNPIDVIADELYGELTDDETANMQNIYLGLRSRLENRHPDVFTSVRQHIDQALTIERQRQELQATYGERMAAYRDGAMIDLASRADWDKMVDTLLGLKWPAEALYGKGIAVAKFQDLASARSSSSLPDMYQEAQTASDLLRLAGSLGCLREEPATEPEDGWFTTADPFNFIQTLETTVKTATNYMSQGRGLQIEHIYKQRMSAIKSLPSMLRPSGPDAPTAPVFLSPLVAACKNRALQIFSEADMKSQAFAEYDAQKQPNTLFIEGTVHMATLERNTGISDMTAWAAQRLSRFGPRFSRGIGFIEFTDDPDSEHLGLSNSAENKLYIDILTHDKIEYDKLDAAKPSRPDVAQELVRKEVENTFDHEMAHHIHRSRLTVAELYVWQQALEAEPDSHINGYMADLTRKGAPERRVNMEQFAITTELYMNRPLQTALKYPARFEALNSIIQRYDPDKVAVVLQSVRTLQSDGLQDAAERMIAHFAPKLEKEADADMTRHI